MGLIAALVLAWLAFEVACGVLTWLMLREIERQDAESPETLLKVPCAHRPGRLPV